MRTPKRPTSRDPLQVQISVRVKVPKGTKPKQLTASLINEAIAYRIENGYDHPKIESKIVRWRNPTRPGGKGSWRQGNQSDAWATLGKWLRRSNVDVITVRNRSGASK